MEVNLVVEIILLMKIISRGALVSYINHHIGEEVRSWNVNFSMVLHDWELDSVTSFFTHIYTLVPTRAAGGGGRGGRGLCCDRMRWCLNGNSTFDVHSFFPWKSIWCVKTPKRVSFFMWTAAWGKILTIDNLFKKGLSLVGWCCLCRCGRKIVSHLLHHCDIIYALWSEVFSRFGVWWVMPMTISSFLFGGGIGL